METVEILRAEFTSKLDELNKAFVEIGKKLDGLQSKQNDFGDKSEVSGRKAKAAFRDVARTLGQLNPVLGKIAWQFAAIDDVVTPLYGHFTQTGNALLGFVKLHPILAGGVAAVTVALGALIYALLRGDEASRKYAAGLEVSKKATEQYKLAMESLAADSELFLKPAEENARAELTITENRLRDHAVRWQEAMALIQKRIYTIADASKYLRQSFDLWGGPDAIAKAKSVVEQLKKWKELQDSVFARSQAGLHSGPLLVKSLEEQVALSETNLANRILLAERELEIVQLLQRRVELERQLAQPKATPWEPWTKGGYHAPPLTWEGGGRQQLEADRPAEAMSWLDAESLKAADSLQQVSRAEDEIADKLWTVKETSAQVFGSLSSAAAGAFTQAVTSAESFGAAITGIIGTMGTALLGVITKIFFEWVAANITETTTASMAAYAHIPWVGLALGAAAAIAAIAAARSIAAKQGGRSFAEGGIVMRPLVATVGDVAGGEVIAPRSRFEELFDRRSDETSTFVFQLDGREFARGTIPYIPGELRRIGIKGM